MRTRTLVVAAVLAAALPGTAASGVVKEISAHSCEVEATNGSAECLVVLDPDQDGFFGQSTWSGYGSADLDCPSSGTKFHLEGGYGSEWIDWPHGAEVCTLSVYAFDGTSSAYVD